LSRLLLERVKHVNRLGEFGDINYPEGTRMLSEPESRELQCRSMASASNHRGRARAVPGLTDSPLGAGLNNAASAGPGRRLEGSDNGADSK